MSFTNKDFATLLEAVKITAKIHRLITEKLDVPLETIEDEWSRSLGIEEALEITADSMEDIVERMEEKYEQR